MDVAGRGDLPEALVAPELSLVDRAIPRLERSKAGDSPLRQHEQADRERQLEDGGGDRAGPLGRPGTPERARGDRDQAQDE